MMKRAPVLSDQLCDIQGLLRSGYGWLKVSRFWLLTIRDGREDEARAWLSALLHSGLIVSAKRVGQAKHEKIDEAAAIAFSFAGLSSLGCAETRAHPFPTPFRSGMGSEARETLLKDGPRQWRWSDVDGRAGRQAAHILVAQWYSQDGETRMPVPDPQVFCSINVIDNHPGSFTTDDGKPTDKLYEPFRFRDGVAQPVIHGLRDADGEALKRARRDAGLLYDDRVVAPGEFILGYRNEYDELSYCPDVERWAQSVQAGHSGGRFGLNGSYLAVRQIEQHVETFNTLQAAYGEALCAKLMGRSKNGLPLSWQGDPKADISDSEADAFRYQTEDANGFMCPRGSHIRRMNPRDALGIDVPSGIKASKLHRLLRRGRPYFEEPETVGGPSRQGIFFIACNADLERQFEFVQQRWMRNSRFANLRDEDDPVVGSSRDRKKFTIPNWPSGDEISLEALTTTLGGGYFFLPGIKALEFVARHSARDLVATAASDLTSPIANRPTRADRTHPAG
jgi:putative iron-dependent peroxidase